MLCCVCDFDTDRTKSDDTKLLALNLCTGKFLLFLLGSLGNILITLIRDHPVNTADDIS